MQFERLFAIEKHLGDVLNNLEALNKLVLVIGDLFWHNVAILVCKFLFESPLTILLDLDQSAYDHSCQLPQQGGFVNFLV